MQTIIIFILVLGLLVLVHEGGHFLAARYFNMKVYEFGVGFPPRALGWYKDPETGERNWVWGKGSDIKETVAGEEKEDEGEFPDTLYSINWLPLGGFVRIKGESGEKRDEEDSFSYKAPWKRIIVLCAGVFMNVVLAAVLLAGGFMIGLPTSGQAADDPNAIVVQEPQTMIQQVSANSPAEEIGLKMGDKVISINGEKIESSSELTNYIESNSNQELSLTIQRGEKTIKKSVTPGYIKDKTDKKRIGVMLADTAVVRYPWYISIYKGVIGAISGLAAVVYGFYNLIVSLAMGQGLSAGVAGPVGIASVIGQSARLGISYLLNITAMISLSLAVINILPIPALDGGRVLFVGLEKLLGRKVPQKYERIAHTIGFWLLIALVVLVTYRDILKVF
jgi:regulator of sigma E protease